MIGMLPRKPLQGDVILLGLSGQTPQRGELTPEGAALARPKPEEERGEAL